MMKVPGEQLAPEWRRWVVENLLRNTEEADLVAELERAGVDGALAREAVKAEAADPYLQGARKALAMRRKLEGLLDVYGDLYRQAEGHARVDRHDALAAGDFFERYYFQNRPVVVRHPVVDAARWPREQLAALLGEAGARDAVAPPALREVLRPPEYVRAEGARAWCEPPGAEVPAAPVRRNLLVCQVHGRRRARLVPAFELHRMSGPEAAGVPRLEVELGPGDALLVPVGWWYEDRVEEASTTLCFESFAAPEPNVPWEPERVVPEPTPPPRSPLS